MPFQMFLRTFLICQIIVCPIAAFPAAPNDLATKQRTMEDAFFNYIVGVAAVVQTPEDFQRLFLNTLNPDDRKAVMDSVRPLKKFPAIYRSGRDLVVDAGLRKATLHWINFAKMAFEIDGVPW